VLVVTPGPTAIVLIEPHPGNLPVKDTVQLSARTLDAGSKLLTGRAVTWSVDNPALASMSASGLLIGLRQGTVEVRATADGITGRLTVNVVPETVMRVTVSPTTPAPLRVGQTVQLTVVPYDRQNNVLYQTPTWSTATPAIASVSSTGLVTALSPGNTKVLIEFYYYYYGIPIVVPIQVVP
jgi:hypothetical protein